MYSDAGTVFTHSLWHEWSELYGVKIVPASARSQWQNGLCERTIDTVKQVTHRLLAKNKESNLVRALEKATFAKNCTPILGTMWPPFTIMTGRPTILDETRVEQLIQLTTQDQHYLHQTSVMDLLRIRREIQETDARQAIKKALAHPLREDIRTTYMYGDAVQIFDSKKWSGTYRVLGTAGSSVILQQSNKIFKHPRCFVRRVATPSCPLEERVEDKNDKPPQSEDPLTRNPRPESPQEFSPPKRARKILSLIHI